MKKFFTEPLPLIASSWFRLLVGLTLAFYYFQRYLDFEWIFSEKGIVPYSLAATMVPDFYKPPITLFASHEGYINAIHIFFVANLLLIGLGLANRTIIWITYLFHICLIQRNYVVIYGPDFIATCWLMYMGLLQPNRYLTLTQLLKRQPLMPRSWSESAKGGVLNTIGVRLIQIQLCVIYGYGGLEKLKGVTWWSGEAIWNTLANGQLTAHDYGFVAHFPWLVAVMTFTTLLWEVYFPVLIWLRSWRPWILAFGVMLHLGIGFTMQIVFFSSLMVWSYVLFLPVDSKFWRKSPL